MSMQTSRNSDGFVETNRETLFIASLVGGTLVFALGFAFSILAVSLNTVPPAPYFASPQDRYLMGGIAVLLMIVGVGIARGGAKLGGW